ncbi:MAG: DUF1254 domain-containing protein, partial [Lachnospiraceae bacterium]|nr:DUF1254 domain-containing protein [Lachnospiraceae bacterium]
VTGKAPVNQFIHNKALTNASFKDVVSPNVDTIYTQVWYDLSEEPIIYVLPETGRFCKVQVLDAWTNTPTVLDQAGTYAITLLSWEGELPEGVTRIDVPTALAWSITRTVLSDEDDLANVRAIQAGNGVKYPKPSKHLLMLYEKKRHSVKDYLHKVTHYIQVYCVENNIHTVVIGDIKGIRRENDLGAVTNQKLHALPYNRIYQMPEYKLSMKGIRLIRQEESWTSQCSPLSDDVSETYARKSNRKKRGLYKDGVKIRNADAVGAYNTLRKERGMAGNFPTEKLSNPEVVKVAV